MEIEVIKLYQDRYLLTIEDMAISEGLIGWIMMLQDGVKVIAPLSLKTEIQRRLQKMVNLYQDML